MVALTLATTSRDRWCGGVAALGILLCGGAAADPKADFTSAAANQKLVVCAAAHAVIAKRTIEAIAGGTDFYSGTVAASNWARFHLVAQAELDLARQRGTSAAVNDQYSNRVAAYSEQAAGFKDVLPLRQMSREFCDPQWTQLMNEGAIRQEDLDALEERTKPELTEQIMEAMRRGERAKAAAKEAVR